MRQGKLLTQSQTRRLWVTCALACMAAAAVTPAAADELDGSAPTHSVMLASAPGEANVASLQLRAPAPSATPAEAAMAPPPAAATASLTPVTSEAAAAHEAETASVTSPPRGSTGLLGLHSDIQFSVLSAPREQVGNGAPDAAFQEQVKRISGSLEVAARGLYPDAVKHIGSFDVYVAQSQDLSTMSSGTGKIAVNAGFATLKPTDDWMAFVIAREMGHVVTGHHDNNAGASIAVSILMNILVPGSGLIKSAISFAGSQVASASGRDKQIKEADDAALKLLEAAGYTTKAVALNLRLNPISEQVSTTSWANAFRISSARLTGIPLVPASAVQEAPLVAGAPASETIAVQSAVVQPSMAQPAPLAQGTTQNVRWQPEEIVRTRPSGLPGPLVLGGYAVPVRRME